MKGFEPLADVLDRCSERLGIVVAWLILVMVGITFAIVVLRYGFSWGRIWMQESYVWLNAIVFLLGAPYALLKDAHVRVDIFYRPAGPRIRAIIDALGAVLLLLPSMVLFFFLCAPYVIQSWKRLESSREANGLPGLFLLKTMLLIFSVLMFLQGLSLLVRSLGLLRRGSAKAVSRSTL